MARREAVELSFKAEIGDLRRELAKVPGVTAKEARKMAAALERQMVRAEKAAKRSAARSRQAWMRTTQDLALGAVAAGAALGTLAQDVADTRNSITDLSTRTGVARETLAGLALAAEGSGLAFSDVESIVGRLPKVMGDVQRGSKAQADAFAALGVEVADAEGNLRSSEVVFRELLGAIAALPTPTEKAAAAAQIFGRNGTKLLQALGDPSSLEAFVQLAGSSAINSAAAADEAGAWQRSMAELNLVLDDTKALVVDGLGITGLVDDFALGLTFANAVVEGFAENVSRRMGLLSTIFEKLFEGEFMDAGRAADRLADEIVNPITKLEQMGDVLSDATDEARQFHALRREARAAAAANTELAGAAEAAGRHLQLAAAGAGKVGAELDAAQAAADRWRATILAAAEAGNPLARQARLVAEINALQTSGALSAQEAMQARLVVIRETNAAIGEGIEAEQAAADKARGIVEAATQHRLTELQRIDAEERKVLAELAATEVASAEQVAAVKLEFHRQRMEAIDDEVARARVSAQQQALAFEGLFGGMADASRQAAELIGQHNEQAGRRAFAAYKASAIAQAAINGAVAFTKALADLGPIFGPIAAAGVAGSTAAQVAVIAAQQPSFTDTPQAMFAGSRGLTARFAPGDHVIAAQSPREVQRQANDLAGGRGAEPRLIVAPIATYRHYSRVTRDEIRRPSPLAKALRNDRRTGQTGW